MQMYNMLCLFRACRLELLLAIAAIVVIIVLSIVEVVVSIIVVFFVVIVIELLIQWLFLVITLCTEKKIGRYRSR